MDTSRNDEVRHTNILIIMQYLSDTDKREVLQQEYSRSLSLPSPHFRWVVILAFYCKMPPALYKVLHNMISKVFVRELTLHSELHFKTTNSIRSTF